MGLDLFPKDMADELKGLAEKASSSCAQERFGTPGKAAASKIEAGQHFDNFKEKAKSLLSSASCDNIQDIFWREAWHTANTRKGYKSDANKDEAAVKQHGKNLIQGGEVSKALATNLINMGWAAAWYAANTAVGYHDDAVRDSANLALYFSKIQGEVNLVAMNFLIDQAKILSQEPKVVAEQTLINKGKVQQKMAFKFSVTEGKTHSTSHNISFTYGITVGFSAGFFGFAESKYEASFNFSHGHTFAESISTGTRKTYEFPLAVPAGATYVAKALVHEAQMDVPYELVFDFGGEQKSFTGMWRGVAISKVIYEINQNQEPIFQTFIGID